MIKSFYVNFLGQLSILQIGESGWRSGHQLRLPPLRPGIESARGLKFVDLNLTPRVFLPLQI